MKSLGISGQHFNMTSCCHSLIFNCIMRSSEFFLSLFPLFSIIFYSMAYDQYIFANELFLFICLLHTKVCTLVCLAHYNKVS